MKPQPNIRLPLRIPERLPPKPRSPIQLRPLRLIARRARSNQVLRHRVPTSAPRADMVQRPRRLPAVGTPAPPRLQNSLPKPQLGKPLRAEKGSIDVMVQHALPKPLPQRIWAVSLFQKS